MWRSRCPLRVSTSSRSARSGGACYIATYTDRTAEDILVNLNVGADEGGRYYFAIDPEAVALDVEGCPTWTLADEH